ncbi:phage head-tail connector protein [Sporosarcina limicola]|uniref:Phage head-tail adapter protein n=1 Tax=Sporosarcina limicola TaxID=34101 RepID=A0A927MP60_9BACL|nr:phage head-tail connector protein [Sporosarcina limicola]MBE1554801.1 hypothetical protein [Sporosarcina limicola]
MEQLEKLKLQLGIKDDKQDDSLKLMLSDVESEILVWTNRDILPASLESTCRQIAVIQYNSQGVEGQSSHSEGGISRTFETLPDSIKSKMNQRRLAKVVRYAT